MKKIIRVLLACIFPPLIYFGITGIGKFAKATIPEDENIPNFIEGIGIIIVGGFCIGLIVLCLWACYWFAGLIMEEVEGRLTTRRLEREIAERYAAEDAAQDQDELYRQRIGVE